MPELLGRPLLRSVPAVVEQGDIPLLRPPEMVLKAVDDRLPRGLLVEQRRRQVEPERRVIVAALEVFLHAFDVVDAPVEPGDRLGIAIDADQQSIERSHRGSILLTYETRPASGVADGLGLGSIR